MRLLVDAQLPPRRADWLRSGGHECWAVREIGLRDASDQEIWAFAGRESAVIITKDDDFAEMAARLSDGPAVLWVRCGNVVNRELLKRFEQAWPIAETLLGDGAKLVEMR